MSIQEQVENILAKISFLPGCEEEGFLIIEVRLSIFDCSIFMALLASESWIMLQIRLQAVILSYGLAQDGGDLSPFTPRTIEIAMKQAWKGKRILTICRLNVLFHKDHKWIVRIVYPNDWSIVSPLFLFSGQAIVYKPENFLACGPRPMNLVQVYPEVCSMFTRSCHYLSALSVLFAYVFFHIRPVPFTHTAWRKVKIRTANSLKLISRRFPLHYKSELS